MRPTLALLPSALLGPAVWRPVAAELARRGWPTAELTSFRPAPETSDDVVAAYLDALPVGHPLVLVPHSNAGAFVPVLAAQREVAAAVFVDAGIPPRHGDTAVAPPGLMTFLDGLADADGRLPPWTEWWGEAVGPLFPDVDVRRRVEAEQHRLPLSYFAGRLPAPAGWDDRPMGYLAFGDTYDADRRTATQRGWPVRTLTGGHLHMLVDPPAVADALVALVEQLS